MSFPRTAVVGEAKTERGAICVSVLLEHTDHAEHLLAVLEKGGLDAEYVALGTERAEDYGAGAIALVDTDAIDVKQVAAIRARGGRRVVAIMDGGEAGARAALSAGVDGIVVRSEVDSALAPTVLAVAAGQLVAPSSLRSALNKPTLTAREKQILGMVVMGFPNREIASRLFLAESTVKSHLRSSFRRLGVRSRKEATALILDESTGFGTGILGIPQS